MKLQDIIHNAINAKLITITSGEIQAKINTYTQNYSENNRFDCVINSWYFEHPKQGGILIDAGFSSDFHHHPPYGNLNFIMKAFQKLNGVKYKQKEKVDTAFQLSLMEAKPKHIFLTHRHPDHTSAISQLPDQMIVHYGKKEDTRFYDLLTKRHLKGKNKQLIDFENAFAFEDFERVIDVFGDASFFALSTKGHTKDHISYLLNGDKTYLIVGDAELTLSLIHI